MECDYCGFTSTDTSLYRARYGKWACVDTRACDKRDEERHRAYLAYLRKRKREGDELTEAERHDLAST